jgi:hypothetical protein
MGSSAPLAEDRWVVELERAVETLRALAHECEGDERARAHLEAVSARLASCALAVQRLAEAGVSAERRAALVERGWSDAAIELEAAELGAAQLHAHSS